MKIWIRIIALALIMTMLAAPALAAKKKATPTPGPREITTEVVEEVPEKIQELLDLAYNEWKELDGKKLKKSNKYTKWRNNYEWGWCAGFITWCMLELDVPQSVWTEIKEGEVDGIVHVKEAGVGKVVTGYTLMHRTTLTPQKGFIVVYGKKGKNGLWHAGLVYDVEKLPNGKYRLTTIEGNVNSSVWMYVHDYDPNAEKKTKNISLVPEEERISVDSTAFSYHYTYNDKDIYVNMFLMPWVPEGMSGEDLPVTTPVP